MAIFKWVNDNTGWIRYDSTKKGALGILKSKKGNCCDLTHLVVALERAAGIPHDMYMVTATSAMDGVDMYGHKYMLMVNGTQQM